MKIFRIFVIQLKIKIMNNSNLIGSILGFFVIIMALSIIMAWPVQLLWNGCLVPAIEGVNQIGFWQALGLNILFSILFKSSSNTSK
jgi:hypothetical protein